MKTTERIEYRITVLGSKGYYFIPNSTFVDNATDAIDRFKIMWMIQQKSDDKWVKWIILKIVYSQMVALDVMADYELLDGNITLRIKDL